MAVSEQTPYKEYTANGSANSFALEFDCENQDHLIVLVDDVEPVVGTWSLSNGTVVFNTPPSDGKKITIRRNTPVLRSTNFQSFNNSLRPDAINKDLDRVWLRLQEEDVAKFLLNQLINMNYEDLDEKGQNIRTELIDELTIQADELDQKIQTTASQLNNQIIQQGVSQQQLQNYYSFLQGQMANLSSDKNWVSSLIADASGKNQQQINDLVKAQLIRTSNYELINDQAIDQSVKLQAIANIAKAGSKTLIIDSLTSVVYAAMNVDITGLAVDVMPSVSFIAPLSATNQYTFTATGTAADIAPKTILKNANLDAVNRMRGIFKAEYVNEPLAYNCSAKNVPTGVSPDGSGVAMIECYKPRVEKGYYHGGRQGVLFTSCTNPVADGVKTEHQGRDGILFYTNPTGTTTTDAVSINCNASDYCINGEAGRAGVHFYGVRRARAIIPTVSDDSGQTFDDTAAVRFRDCEDYYTDGYDVENVRTGIVVNEVGDYAGAPHNIIVRGAIGVGNVKNTRKYGVAAATPGRICNIIGATVTNSGQVLSGAGIYSAADGNISGCIVDGTTDAPGISAAGENTITGNTLKNAGRQTNDTAQIIVSGKAVLNGNTFKNTDGTSNLAIRGIGNAELTIGANNYDANISRQLLLNSTATLKRGGSLIKTQFAGVPSVTGIFELGVQLIDSNGVVFVREGGAWKRQAPRSITATVETSQTTIAHGLGYKPTEINIQVKSNANVWQSAEADTTNIYLTSSVAGASVNVSCR